MMAAFLLEPFSDYAQSRASHTPARSRKMKRTLIALFVLLTAFAIPAAAQETNANSKTNTNANTTATTPKKKRGPVFRANKDQIKQAQAMLKERKFYTGEQTGKLDADTRAGLKKYQEAEKIKVTGTLNRVTLEKMNITLTDKQKAM
jgi:peptidoglycan hydrolase-like protein with peptidoglycan-binding domain